jgi:hypothetical protein
VQSSTLHPVFRGSALRWDMRMGGYPDPTTRGSEKQFEGFVVALQRAAYRRALATVAARRPVIETVAQEMVEGSGGCALSCPFLLRCLSRHLRHGESRLQTVQWQFTCAQWLWYGRMYVVLC